MRKAIFLSAILALALSACNSKPAETETTVEVEETPAVATDSITAAIERLNTVFASGESSTRIDSLVLADGVLTFYSTSPAGFLDEEESVKWLPSMAVNELPLLGQGALQQIVDGKIVVRFNYVDQADPTKTHNFRLREQDVADKIVK